MTSHTQIEVGSRCAQRALNGPKQRLTKHDQITLHAASWYPLHRRLRLKQPSSYQVMLEFPCRSATCIGANASVKSRGSQCHGVCLHKGQRFLDVTSLTREVALTSRCLICRALRPDRVSLALSGPSGHVTLEAWQRLFGCRLGCERATAGGHLSVQP